MECGGTASPARDSGMRDAAAKRLRSVRGRFRNVITLSRSLGVVPTVVYIWHKVRMAAVPSSRPYRLLSKDSRYPLVVRPNTSDLLVFRGVFIEREYACLNDLPGANLIIDCGANVGYSSAYFLSRFPECRVVAVEPDPSNFSILETNLAPYGERVRAIRTGVWSHPADLKIEEAVYRDGQHWATQVRECRVGERPEMQAVDIPTLLRASGSDSISILKMDVEGAEAMVFSGDCGGWLPYVDNIVIELHDDSSFGDASSVFFNAVADRAFDVTRSGELTVCKSAT